MFYVVAIISGRKKKQQIFGMNPWEIAIRTDLLIKSNTFVLKNLTDGSALQKHPERLLHKLRLFIEIHGESIHGCVAEPISLFF